AQAGCLEDAQNYIKQMQQDGVTPDSMTFSRFLSVCADMAAITHAKWVHDQIIKNRIKWSVSLTNSFIDMYSKCGNLDDARSIFDQMESKDIISWNSMIGACGQHGCGQEALKLFHQMQQEDIKPDAITFVAL